MKRNKITKNKYKISIIGLGYVGLPLAVEFSGYYNVIGYDINSKRINELRSGLDRNLEIKTKNLKKSNSLFFTSNNNDLIDTNVFIITVPTPIFKNKEPDLSLLTKATKTVGKFLKPGNIVIYESTVYPGTTEEYCVPILENISGLRYLYSNNKHKNINNGFYCGYSPERINPGDKNHDLRNICKITSGSTPKISNIIDKLYKKIIIAGTYKAPSIKVAEAAKIIENTQRDINIALINELAIIFNHLKIDTHSVLEAASTKWNFLPFKPGLVGGHCIGVDPYYLTYKSKLVGYKPKVVLAGRKINDSMGFFVAQCLMKEMNKKNIKLTKANILIMGLAFKENCSDIRNSRVIDIIEKLKKNNCKIDVYDPEVDQSKVFIDYKIKPILKVKENFYDAVIIAVTHDRFKKMGIKKIKKLCKKTHIIYDIKNLFGIKNSDIRL